MASSTGMAVGLTRRTKQILETKTDDETLLQSLTALSNVENLEGGQMLQSEGLATAIEGESVQRASNILNLADKIMKQLDLLQQGISDLSSCANDIHKEIKSCNTVTRPYLDAIAALESAERLNKEKEGLVDDFLNRYQLLPEEVTMLQSGDVTDDFFSALQRAQSIHTNCKNLLRTQHQRAGLELMDTMAHCQEAALKRLVQWIQTKCQDLIDVEAAELDPLMQQALEALSVRPVLYRYCAEEVAEARRDALFERFIGSLSQGPRPIEMQSDDPKRYINDMLAWVHQSLASEIELLELLLKDASRVHEEQASELPSITDLLGKVFHSIDRPLKVRIEQVLMLPPLPVLCYELACLLEFYVATIRDVAGAQFTLVEGMQSCLDMAVRTLHEQIHARGIRLSRHSIVVPRDLSPPVEIMDTMQFLAQILNASDSVLKATKTQEGLSIETIVSAVLDPLLATCRKCASDLELGSLNEEKQPTKLVQSKNIFLINTLDALATALKGRSNTATKCKDLTQQLHNQEDTLAKEIALVLLTRCGLKAILDRMEEYKTYKASGRSMAEDTSLRLAIITQSLHSFFALLSSSDSLPEFAEIVDVEVRSTAVHKMCHLLSDAYERVYTTVLDPVNGYGQSTEIMPLIKHSPEEIKTVLSLSERYQAPDHSSN